MKNNNNRGFGGGNRWGNNNHGFFGQNSNSFLRRDAVTQDNPYTLMGESDMKGDALRPEARHYQKRRVDQKYPIHSDIQEIHDKMQTMYVIGASLVEQKTMDVSDSQFITTIPIGMATIMSKGFGFLITYLLLFTLANFLMSFVYPLFAENYSYNPFLVFFFLPICFSLFFYKYFIASMRQYVIESETQARTKKFHSIVVGFWRPVEITIVALMLISLFIYWKSLVIVQSLQGVWMKVAHILKLQETMFDRERIIEFFCNFTIFACMLAISYFVFSFILDTSFRKKQKENYLDLLIQRNPSRAVDELLNGKI